MSNPRIYIAIATFHPKVGGAEKQALLQGRSLRERGIAATIVTFHHDKTWLPSEMIEGVPVIRIAGSLLGHRENLPRILQKLYYLIALGIIGWTLWRNRHQYDALHVYQLTLLVLPAAFVCRLTNKPLIVAVRSASSGKSVNSHNKVLPIAEAIDNTVPGLQVDGAVQFGGDLADLERWGKPLVHFTRFLLLRNRAVIVVLSSRMKEYLDAHSFNLPDMQLIPNGVDIKRFHIAESVNDPGGDVPGSIAPGDRQILCSRREHTVVCISRLSYEKGIDVLLQAWHLVHQQMPQARLIIVGDGPLQPRLVCMAQALGIVDSVEFTGAQSDIPAQLHRGKLAVLPSRFEGMPNAVLEAMACGLPCVATRVSGSEDIIEHGANGLLVEIEDYQHMAQALLMLLTNPDLTKKYGQAARTTIEKNYSLEYVTDMYEKLYSKITDGRFEKVEQKAYVPIVKG